MRKLRLLITDLRDWSAWLFAATAAAGLASAAAYLVYRLGDCDWEAAWEEFHRRPDAAVIEAALASATAFLVICACVCSQGRISEAMAGLNRRRAESGRARR